MNGEAEIVTFIYSTKSGEENHPTKGRKHFCQLRGDERDAAKQVYPTQHLVIWNCKKCKN